MGNAAESSAQQKAMNTPITAANTIARNDPVPAVTMMSGTIMNTDDAGVTADIVIAMFPKTFSERDSSCSYAIGSCPSIATLPGLSNQPPDADSPNVDSN